MESVRLGLGFQWGSDRIGWDRIGDWGSRSGTEWRVLDFNMQCTRRGMRLHICNAISGIRRDSLIPLSPISYPNILYIYEIQKKREKQPVAPPQVPARWLTCDPHLHRILHKFLWLANSGPLAFRFKYTLNMKFIHVVYIKLNRRFSGSAP